MSEASSQNCCAATGRSLSGSDRRTSLLPPGVVQGWHYHKKQTDHLVGVLGMSKVVLFDPCDNSGEQNPTLVKIPPLVIHGYKVVDDRMSAIVNFPTELYNYQEPDEFRIPCDSPDIPYDWAVKQR